MKVHYRLDVETFMYNKVRTIRYYFRSNHEEKAILKKRFVDLDDQ